MWTLCTGTRFFGFCSHGFCKHGDSGYFAPLATLLWKMVSGEWRTPPLLFFGSSGGQTLPTSVWAH